MRRNAVERLMKLTAAQVTMPIPSPSICRTRVLFVLLRPNCETKPLLPAAYHVCCLSTPLSGGSSTSFLTLGQHVLADSPWQRKLEPEGAGIEGYIRCDCLYGPTLRRQPGCNNSSTQCRILCACNTGAVTRETRASRMHGCCIIVMPRRYVRRIVSSTWRLTFICPPENWKMS